jgi:hypothetical protein
MANAPYQESSETVTVAEHISPLKSGDNISAKKTANYSWNLATLQWERVPSGAATANNQTNGQQKTLLVDEYNNIAEFTMLNQVKVAQNFRLSGGLFNGSLLDTNFFTTVVQNGGTVAVTGGEALLSLTTTANSYAGIFTNSLGRYMGGNMNYYRSAHIFGDSGAVNNVRRNGCCDTTSVLNGLFFQSTNNLLQLVVRKNGVDTVVNSGSFNGNGIE